MPQRRWFAARSPAGVSTARHEVGTQKLWVESRRGSATWRGRGMGIDCLDTTRLLRVRAQRRVSVFNRLFTIAARLGNETVTRSCRPADPDANAEEVVMDRNQPRLSGARPGGGASSRRGKSLRETYPIVTVAPATIAIAGAPRLRVTVEPSSHNGLLSISQIMTNQVATVRERCTVCPRVALDPVGVRGLPACP
jgi:hypothetical protein